jgi:hypothetical protein
VAVAAFWRGARGAGRTAGNETGLRSASRAWEREHEAFAVCCQFAPGCIISLLTGDTLEKHIEKKRQGKGAE